jgi:uncharacterized YkwD family protein
MKNDPYLLTALVKLIEIATSPSTSTITDQSARILKLVNAERIKIGIQPLKINSALNELAKMKSQDMVDRNYFSHHSDAFGSSFDLMKSHGINYMVAGENLAIDNTADNAHSAWMNSKVHKDNILNPSFTETGIGVYAKGNNSYAYTQVFIG